jgi:DMSO/TMAO reductase YedYZ molybdopterin-dependent catalytic subunit
VPAVTPQPEPHTRDAASTALLSASVGAVSVATALGTQELSAGLIRPLPSLMAGSAAWVIDIAPGWLVEWAIRNLEDNTRPTLILAIVVVLVSIGILLSWFTPLTRAIAFSTAGVIGAIATATSGINIAWSTLNAMIAVAVGLSVDRWLHLWLTPWMTHSMLAKTAEALEVEHHDAHGASRRMFITSIAAIGAFAIAAAVGGRRLIENSILRLSRREDVVLPAPTAEVQPVTAAHDFVVEGLEPIITPNDRFFTVDINALQWPTIDLPSWTLTIDGLVENPLTFTYEDLLDMELVEQYATISCVSNKVGGRLVGHAKWLGIPFVNLLEMAGAYPTADQVAAFGADNFATGFPTAAVFDRETLLAVGMNGEPLPHKHGFPARLIVPGYYGFMSAAKWVERITFTTWEEHDAYWVRIGWAKDAPVVTQSRIDAPRDNTEFTAGERMIAGVAWAPFHGITAVEVQIDDGPWQETQLSEPLGPASWRQWQLPWNATPGEHRITVRATDGTGTTQTPDTRPPVPNGATGHHRVKVRAL